MTRRTAILARLFLVSVIGAATLHSSLRAQTPLCHIKDFTASIGESASAMRSDLTTEIVLRYNGTTPCSVSGFPQVRLAQKPYTTFTVDREGLVTEHSLVHSKTGNPQLFTLLKINSVSAMTYRLVTPKDSYGKTYIMRPHSKISFNLETPEKPCDDDECGPKDCEPVDIVLIGPFQKVHDNPKADSLGNHSNDYRELSEADLKSGNYILIKGYKAQTCGGASVTSLYRP